MDDGGDKWTMGNNYIAEETRSQLSLARRASHLLPILCPRETTPPLHGDLEHVPQRVLHRGRHDSRRLLVQRRLRGRQVAALGRHRHRKHDGVHGSLDVLGVEVPVPVCIEKWEYSLWFSGSVVGVCRWAMADSATRVGESNMELTRTGAGVAERKHRGRGGEVSCA